MEKREMEMIHEMETEIGNWKFKLEMEMETKSAPIVSTMLSSWAHE